VTKTRKRQRRPIEIKLTGYSVNELAEELEVPRDVVIKGIRSGAIRAERYGKRVYTIPYSERMRLHTETA
jgi:excisionase family DNA binding protein